MLKPHLVGNFTMRPKHVLLEFGAYVGFSYNVGPGPKNPLLLREMMGRVLPIWECFLTGDRHIYIYITCRA